MIVYHGNDKIIDNPKIEKDTVRGDYGPGFYCTMDENTAREWASTYTQSGYVNQYEFTQGRLKMVDLCDGNFTILSWLAVLLKYRSLDMKSSLTMERRDYIVENFLPDLEKVDIIKGIRADNTNFYIAKQFLNNSVSLATFRDSIGRLENEAELVLCSEKALTRMIFLKAEPVLWQAYFSAAVEKDLSLRQEFLVKKASERVSEELFIADIIKKGWTQYENKLPPMLYR